MLSVDAILISIMIPPSHGFTQEYEFIPGPNIRPDKRIGGNFILYDTNEQR